MYITQLSVFVENKTGRLSEILDELTAHNINIRALSMADTEKFGILRMIVDNTEKAGEILKASGVIVKNTPVIAIDIDDTPGGLGAVIAKLSANDVAVEYLYAFLSKDSPHAKVVLKVNDTAKAEELLK